MIFQRALRRELVSTAGGAFTTLFTITITFMLIKILGQAAADKIASQDVVALIGFQALNYLPIILMLTGYVSVLLVVSRSYQDSEMVVWFASGLSLSRWIRPVLTFGLPIILMTGVLSFVLTPWANQRSNEYRQRFEQRQDVSRVSAGRFQESASGNRVFFVEGLSSDTTKVKNVFVDTVEAGRNSIVVAHEGSLVTNANGDQFVVLEKGRRYDGVSKQSDFRLMQFERYGLLVGSQSQATAASLSASAMPTLELLDNPTPVKLGELLWRTALPIMALALLLLAIPLSFVNPRVGRSANLLIAILLFAVYSNSVSFFQATVVQERLPFMLAWWPIHFIVLGLILIFFTWRLTVNSSWHPSVWWSSRKNAKALRKLSNTGGGEA